MLSDASETINDEDKMSEPKLNSLELSENVWEIDEVDSIFDGIAVNFIDRSFF